MNARSRGIALIVIGVVLITMFSRPARASTVGVAGGALLMVVGFVQLMRVRRGDPPR